MKKAILFISIAVMLVAAIVLAITFIPKALEDKKLTIGIANTSAAICYLNPNGEWDGVNCDIIKQVAEEAGYTVEFKEIPWSQRDELLKNGEIDCYIESYDNHDSQKISTETFLYSTQTLIYKDIFVNDNINSEILKHYSCAVQVGSYNYNYAATLKVKKISEYNSVADIIAAIKNDACSVGIIDYGIYLATIKDSTNYSDIVSGILTGECEYRLVFRRDDEKRVKKINDSIEKLKSDNTIAGIIEQYNTQTEYPFNIY